MTGMEIPVIIGLTALSTGVSVAMSAQANRQAKAIAEYQNRQKALAYAKSVAYNRAVGQVKAAEDKRTLQLKYDLMRGASLAQGAERGTLESRVQDVVLNSLGIGVARESSKIELEREMADLGYQINAQPQWNVAGGQSTFLSGIAGGLQGLQLGLSVAGSIGDYNTQQALQRNASTAGGTGGGGFRLDLSGSEGLDLNLGMNLGGR